MVRRTSSSSLSLYHSVCTMGQTLTHYPSAPALPTHRLKDHSYPGRPQLKSTATAPHVIIACKLIEDAADHTEEGSLTAFRRAPSPVASTDSTTSGSRLYSSKTLPPEIMITIPSPGLSPPPSLDNPAPQDPRLSPENIRDLSPDYFYQRPEDHRPTKSYLDPSEGSEMHGNFVYDNFLSSPSRKLDARPASDTVYIPLRPGLKYRTPSAPSVVCQHETAVSERSTTYQSATSECSRVRPHLFRWFTALDSHAGNLDGPEDDEVKAGTHRRAFLRVI